jgi:hypothetical protein
VFYVAGLGVGLRRGLALVQIGGLWSVAVALSALVPMKRSA